VVGSVGQRIDSRTCGGRCVAAEIRRSHQLFSSRCPNVSLASFSASPLDINKPINPSSFLMSSRPEPIAVQLGGLEHAPRCVHRRLRICIANITPARRHRHHSLTSRRRLAASWARPGERAADGCAPRPGWWASRVMTVPGWIPATGRLCKRIDPGDQRWHPAR
jgi:hypothetical protein